MIEVAPRYDLNGKRIWVAGHRGMVGSALVRRLKSENCEILSASRDQLDLRRQDAVEKWMARERPDALILAAATVGGIHANSTRPAEFLYDNVTIAGNIIESAHKLDVGKVLYLGSSCIYPRLAPQPMSEDALLTGPLEPTNQWYAIAKISGIMLCCAYRKQYGHDFISAMPTNLYGIGDNFDLMSSHVIPALMAKAHAAKQESASQFTVWGSGMPRREFMYVDDLADALVFLLRNYSADKHVNIGVGYDVTIREIAELIARVVGVEGRLAFDSSKPDGAPRKLLDSGLLLSMGWKPRVDLEEGLKRTYRWYVENVDRPLQRATRQS
jgi:GDP-L-fucose synthase